MGYLHNYNSSYIGDHQLVFVSPENLYHNRALGDMLRSSPYQTNLAGLVVDEAHCVDKW